MNSNNNMAVDAWGLSDNGGLFRDVDVRRLFDDNAGVMSPQISEEVITRWNGNSKVEYKYPPSEGADYVISLVKRKLGQVLCTIFY